MLEILRLFIFIKWIRVTRSSSCKRICLWLAGCVIVSGRYSSTRGTSKRRCSCHSSSLTIFKPEIIQLYIYLKSSETCLWQRMKSSPLPSSSEAEITTWVALCPTKAPAPMSPLLVLLTPAHGDFCPHGEQHWGCFGQDLGELRNVCFIKKNTLEAV